MNRPSILAVLLLILLLPIGCQEFLSGSLSAEDLVLEESDRLLVLAPHPDDEVLGGAGVIQRARQMGLPVHILFLTYGDYNEWSFTVYRRRPSLTPAQVRRAALVRHDEALTAAALLGVPQENVIFLGYPDFGTLSIWYRYWGDVPPFRGRLTRATAVPYPNARRPDTPYRADKILHDVKSVIEEVQPTKIFVSHPADTHPDHRALYLYAQVALWELAPDPMPGLFPYLVHYPAWPQPRQYDPTAELMPPPDLEETILWYNFPLTDEELSGKEAALAAHRTQMGTGGRFLRRFIRVNELFGEFPPIKLHPGAPPLALESEEEGIAPAVPEQLTEAEEMLFVEAESELIRLENDRLILTLQFSRRLRSGNNVSLYLFGYRPDTPFAQMPKLQIQFTERSQTVYDQRERLPNDSVQIDRQGTQVIVDIPLVLLNDPERLLLGARSYTGQIPLDWEPWRIIEMP